MGKKIEYTNGEMTIIWQPELCQIMVITPFVYSIFFPMFIIFLLDMKK